MSHSIKGYLSFFRITDIMQRYYSVSLTRGGASLKKRFFETEQSLIS